MKQDPENGKEDPGDAAPPSSLSATFAAHPQLIARFYSESASASWGLSLDSFSSALQRSSAKHFSASPPSLLKLEEYLGALHLADLALACSCAEGRSEAWDHFVHIYRPYLRSAAAAILRCSSVSPAACELADSLFADLYGLSVPAREMQDPAATSRAQPAAAPPAKGLFRYFHGRSSLKTWLRAVLAQRHIDSIRANRRFTALEDGDLASPATPQFHAVIPITQTPPDPDPHRRYYLALFASAFESAIAQLDPRDRERLRLYYADQQTLADIGRALGEHESSVSRNLDRIRRDLRDAVEAALRTSNPAANGLAPKPALSDAQIALCFHYASEDAPIDLDKLLPQPAQPTAPKPSRPQS
jgi:RNA polymerase sigma factor (sigma-70 family)